MSKSSKSKKAKVPKLTEAEYAAYISALKGEEISVAGGALPPVESMGKRPPVNPKNE